MSARQEASEEGFLLQGVFGWIHRPAQKTAHGCGVLLCGPFGAATTGVHRNWRQFAMMLAHAGFVTLRFDYPGTGDAAELESTERIGAWVETIKTLAAWLQQQEGLREVALCGLRFGALLAAQAANAAQPLVLLAPPRSGRAYARELTIAGSASPAGEGVEADGLCLSRAEVAALERLELQPKQGPVLCLGPAWERRAMAGRITFGEFEDFRSFMLPAYSAEFPEAALRKVVLWLTQLGGDAIAQRRPPPAEAVLHLPGGVAERRFHFGRHGGLFAIEARPAQVDTARPAVLILNSGAEPHTGHSRVNVLLARRLAESGLATVRMDLSGFGDSKHARLEPDGQHSTARLAWLRSYRPEFIADALDAVEMLAQRGYRQCILIGLCSGANLALHAARRDARVVGLVLINPTFLDRDLVDVVPAAPVPRGKLRRCVRAGLSALGLTEPRRRQLREYGRWLAQEARWAAARLLRWDKMLDNPARWLWPLHRRRVAMLAICSEGDESIRDWWLYAARVWPHAGNDWRKPVLVPGQSHSFEPMLMRDALIEHICRHLGQ